MCKNRNTNAIGGGGVVRREGAGMLFLKLYFNITKARITFWKF